MIAGLPRMQAFDSVRRSGHVAAESTGRKKESSGPRSEESRAEGTVNRLHNNHHRRQSSLETLIALVLSAFLLTACGGGGGGDAAPAAVGGPNPTPPPVPPPAPGNGSATLSWQPPTFYSDNTTPLTIAGYKFYGGTSQANLTLLDTVTNGGIATHMLTGLQTGTTWFFAVTAYDAQGIESTFSNVATISL